jgi:hypothetical protein
MEKRRSGFSSFHGRCDSAGNERCPFFTLFHLDNEIRIVKRGGHVWIGCLSNADLIRTGLYKPSDVSRCFVGTVTAYLNIIHEDQEFDK